MKNKPLNTEYIKKKEEEWDKLPKDSAVKFNWLGKLTHPENRLHYEKEVQEIVRNILNS